MRKQAKYNEIRKQLIAVPEDFQGEFVIPDGTISIGTYAFNYCTRLTNVTIPNSVTYIEGSAFIGCTALTSVTIPNSVTFIGMNAFSNCSPKLKIKISQKLTKKLLFGI